MFRYNILGLVVNIEVNVEYFVLKSVRHVVLEDNVGFFVSKLEPYIHLPRLCESDPIAGKRERSPENVGIRFIPADLLPSRAA